MDLVSFMVWCYEIRGTGNRLFQMRTGFKTEKEAQQVGERAKKNLIQSVAYLKATEPLILLAFSDMNEKPKAATRLI
jgi:hypothetical protein